MQREQKQDSPGWKKRFVTVLIVAMVIVYFASLPIAFNRNRVLMTIPLICLVLVAAVAALLKLLTNVQIDQYMHKHHIRGWKRSKSLSPKQRLAASKQTAALARQIPHLAAALKRTDRLTAILFAIWSLIMLATLATVLTIFRT